MQAEEKPVLPRVAIGGTIHVISAMVYFANLLLTARRHRVLLDAGTPRLVRR